VRTNTLGDYLRARREQICPEDVGLVAGARRRVADLRREEVATLPGISFDWDRVTDMAVSEFREVAGTDLGDPRLRAMLGELSAQSPRFRELWERADVGYRPGPMQIRHPRFSDLHLHRTRLGVPHSYLTDAHPSPGSAKVL
jgi:hypothetical protein